MSRLLALIATLLTLVLLIGAGGLWFAERTTRAIESAGERVLGLTVETGEYRIDGWNTLIIRDLQVQGPDRFGREPQITVENVRIQFSPLDFRPGQVGLQAVVLDGLTIRFRVRRGNQLDLVEFGERIDVYRHRGLQRDRDAAAGMVVHPGPIHVRSARMVVDLGPAYGRAGQFSVDLPDSIIGFRHDVVAHAMPLNALVSEILLELVALSDAVYEERIPPQPGGALARMVERQYDGPNRSLERVY